ncbi:MAG: SDR family NAD(P)-dependent oxidoreductase [Polyangiaceae bacterium]
MPPRTVLLTGGSSGIGQALAHEFARRGTHVALAARRLGTLETIRDRIVKDGGKCTVYALDVSDVEAASECVRKADRDLGRLDMVIANAGIGGSGKGTPVAWESVDEVFRTNVAGCLATLVAATHVFMHHQGGHLVAVTSLAGRRGLPGVAAYSASKAAVSTFLESTRIDLASTGIHVTDVQPGFVDTPINQEMGSARPFLWQPPKAARVIVDRLERKPAVIAFPWQLDVATRFARILPAWMWARVAPGRTPRP